MKKPRFVSNQIYHIYNRGVEKRDVFLDETDYLRGIHDLFEFNDTAPTSSNFSRYPNIPESFRLSRSGNFTEVEPPFNSSRRGRKFLPRLPRNMLVEILAFCLMPNHFHLMLRQLKENGIVRFMQKLGTGYTMYFNEKYEREGALFQGRFKAVAVTQEPHFIHLPYYIHCNPLDLQMPEWREQKLRDYKKAIRFLESYRWSSHPDYLGRKNFPSVTSRELLLEVFGGTDGYRRALEDWLKNLNLDAVRDVVLEKIE